MRDKGLFRVHRSFAAIGVSFIGCILMVCLIPSCIISDYSHLSQTGHKTLTKGTLPKVFPAEFSSAVYDASIDAYGNHFSGLLVIKRMKGETFRTVLTTKFGSNLFDFSFPEGSDSLVVHQCREELNRPRFISLYKRDINLLLMRDILPAQAKALQSKSGKGPVYRIKKPEGRHFYYLNENEKQLRKIEQAGFMKGKRVMISLKSANSMQPSRIVINHQGVDLEVELALIKSN